MKLYLAGADTYFEFLHGLDDLAFLVSYFYLKDNKSWNLVEYANEHEIPIMLDCGAWSAYQKGIELSNQEYISFVKEYGKKFDIIVAMDVIGNWQKTRNNYEEMEEAGIECMPTFHYGSPLEELEWLCHQSNYIGIGGIATRGNEKSVTNWLKYIYSLFPNHKFHGFGVTTPLLLRLFNWYSIDGTTWMTAAIRYGRIMADLGNGKIRWVQVQDQYSLKKNWDLVKEIEPGWSLENGRTDCYEQFSCRFNAKSLISLIKYCSQNKVKERQNFLL